ncbi:hypothetical protein BD769DRAFT_1386692 [Suillus cothurnatus]|nr:hypothetical protein BD769DRAFT_1386692 [Suillus cothurnatus]
MIAAVAKNTSPLTMAMQENFSNGILHPLHTGKHTLQLLVDIAKRFDPWDLDKFQKVAKALNLSGVHMPYWHDWIYACPSIFLAGKILHTCIKFFADHLLKWVNHTCAIPPRFIHAIRGLVEFTYLAQNPVHSPQSLQAMTQTLLDFHSFKDAIIAVEARKGKNGVKEDFFIPKLELLQSFEAWQSKDFTKQCIHILNHQESMEIFDLYALLTSHGVPLVNTIHAEDEEVETTNPALSWVSRILPDKVKSGILSEDALTTFQLNVMPDYKSLSPAEIHTKYSLPDFDHALTDFIHCSLLASGEHTHWDPKYGCFQAWNKFQLQLHSAFQPQPSLCITLLSNNFPLDNCDTILIDSLGVDGNITSYVTQVQLIFQPMIQQGSDLELPSYLSDPLLYVQYFRFASHPEDCTHMMNMVTTKDMELLGD